MHKVFDPRESMSCEPGSALAVASCRLPQTVLTPSHRTTDLGVSFVDRYADEHEPVGQIRRRAMIDDSPRESKG